MKKTYILIITFVIGLSLLSCNDKEPEQFGYVPGALVATINDVTYDFATNPRAVITTVNDTPAVWIFGISNSDSFRELDITIANINNTGTYLIGGNSLSSGYYSYSPETGGASSSYYTDTDTEGEIIVTSYQNNKIAGTFMFEAKKNWEPDTVIHISGQFNLNVSQ